MPKDVRVQKTPNNQFILTIPKALADAMDIEKGSVISFSISGKDELLLKITNEKKR